MGVKKPIGFEIWEQHEDGSEERIGNGRTWKLENEAKLERLHIESTRPGKYSVKPIYAPDPPLWKQSKTPRRDRY